MNDRQACDLGRNLATIATCLLLGAGCSGGSTAPGNVVFQPPPPPQSPPPPQPPPPQPPPGTGPGGLWTGALSWEPRNGLPGGALEVRAFITETGEYRMLLFTDLEEYLQGRTGEQIFGQLRFERQELRTVGDGIWTLADDHFGDEWGSFGMAGDFEPGETITATFQANWASYLRVEQRVGTLTLHYHSTYERPSSLAILQGTYRTADELLSIDAQGVIFYQSSATGCTGNGNAGILYGGYNLYRVEIDVDSCTRGHAFRNGQTYTGLASMGDYNDDGGGFLHSTLELALDASQAPWNLYLHKD